MRDPKRIDEVTHTFNALWKQYPDMRFGQLVSFIMNASSLNFGSMFYCEDDAWLRSIESLTKKDDKEG